MKTENYYIAIDLGAGSGRVILGKFDEDEFDFEVIHRFPNNSKKSFKHLRWNIRELTEKIEVGLRIIAARKLDIKSIGVDTWGVDYALFDEKGKMIVDPVCYRDSRTEGMMEEVFKHISPKELFDRTGIQFLPFNTIFQIYAQNKMEEWPPEAKHLLMMPDIINYYLCGKMVGEFTIASTSQLVNTRSKTWDKKICDRLEIDMQVLPELKQTGDLIGKLGYGVNIKIGLEDVDVVAVASHDTASAIAGTPLQEGWAYISSGTWSLVGIETDAPIIDEASLKFQMTNEGGAYGSNRFLKNVMGLRLLESCRKVWKKENNLLDYDELIRLIENAPDNHHYIFPDDLRFLNPENMVSEIGKTLNIATLNQVEISKIIIESLAFRYCEVIDGIQSITKQKIKGIQIIGGGSQNDYLNQATANATGLKVVAGPVEATAIGNLLVQAITAERFKDLDEGRQYISEHVELRVFEPEDREFWEEKYKVYQQITNDKTA